MLFKYFNFSSTSFISPFSLSESQPRGHQPVTSTKEVPLQHAEDRKRNCSPPSRNKPPTPRKQNQEILKTVSTGLFPSPRPRCRSSFSRHSLATNLGTPDVIIEEVLDERQHRGVCDFLTCSCLTFLSLK